MMAYKTVKASWLIEQFKLMERNKWAYVPGAARNGEVDCSGAFTYWYGQAGSYCPHGSNSMYRTWSTEAGKIGIIDLVPGMAVYRHKDDGREPEKYKSDGLGNFNHVGLYIGDGKCIEAKGVEYGIVISDISSWHYASRLRYTKYDLMDGGVDVISGADAPVPDDIPAEPKTLFPVEGTVTTAGGSLNLRKKPVSGTIMKRIPFGTVLTLKEEQNGWYRTSYDGQSGWVSGDFITINKPAFDRTIVADVHDEENYLKVVSYLDLLNIEYTIAGGDD